MSKHLHLTRRQRFGILKWSLYALFFLFLMLNQTIILSQMPVFGIKLNFLPIALVCICIREGPEKGGIFTVLASTFLCFSGADYGGLSIAVLTVCGVFSAILCTAVLTRGFFPTLLCCLATLLINEGLILAFKVMLGRIALHNLWQIVIPGCLLSMLVFPVIYLIVRSICRTGGAHGV